MENNPPLQSRIFFAMFLMVGLAFYASIIILAFNIFTSFSSDSSLYSISLITIYCCLPVLIAGFTVMSDYFAFDKRQSFSLSLWRGFKTCLLSLLLQPFNMLALTLIFTVFFSQNSMAEFLKSDLKELFIGFTAVAFCGLPWLLFGALWCALLQVYINLKLKHHGAFDEI